MYLTWEHFDHPKREPISTTGHSPFSPIPRPWQSLIYFLPLWICLCWTFYIDGVIQYVAFCVWLLSFRIIFSRFIHVVACISTSFLFLWLNNIPSYAYTNLGYPSTVNRHLGFPPHFLGIMNSAAISIHTNTCVDICLHFSWVLFLRVEFLASG